MTTGAVDEHLQNTLCTRRKCKRALSSKVICALTVLREHWLPQEHAGTPWFLVHWATLIWNSVTLQLGSIRAQAAQE